MTLLLLPSFADVATVMLVMFLSSVAVHRLTSKGPMLWPVLGIIPTLVINLPRIYDWATVSLTRAGGTFLFRGMWFGRCNGIVTVDPANIEYVLKTNFPNFPKGKYFQDRFRDFLGNGIFNADGDSWKLQRRAANAEMHSARFSVHSTAMIADLVDNKLLPLFESLADRGNTVDLQDIFLRFTFDNICTAAFGVDPGCVDVNLPEVAFASSFEEATEFTLFRFVVPPFVWKIMKFLDIGTERRLRIALSVVHAFAEKTVLERRNETCLEKKSDLLSRLMISDTKFSDEFLKDFCISFILAGRDTSSVALTWFFWLLDKHPRVELNILNELSAINSLSIDNLKKLEYLTAALSESLRLYPSVPIDFKEVLEDDTLPDGTVMRSGDRVIYCVYSMARMEAVWGKDCNEFRPERWLKDGVFVAENQFKFPVFNAGPRLCVGKKFAYVQMKMVAAAMLMKYRVEVVAGQDIVPKMTTTLYMKNGLRVVVRRRKYACSPMVV